MHALPPAPSPAPRAQVDLLQANYNLESSIRMTLLRHTLVSLHALTPTAGSSSTDVTRMLLDLKSENVSMRKQIKALTENGPVLPGTPGKRRATFDDDEPPSGGMFRAPPEMYDECRKAGRCINYQLGICKKAGCTFAHECNKCGSKTHGQNACPEQ